MDSPRTAVPSRSPTPCARTPEPATTQDRVRASAAEAVVDIPDGASPAVGGFGLSGIPGVLIRALHAQGTTGLEVVSNNCGVDGRGPGVLLADGRIARVTGS